MILLSYLHNTPNPASQLCKSQPTALFLGINSEDHDEKKISLPISRASDTEWKVKRIITLLPRLNQFYLPFYPVLIPTHTQKKTIVPEGRGMRWNRDKVSSLARRAQVLHVRCGIREQGA